MSLPPMLLHRLASRGLVTAKHEFKQVSETVEEIIAENYDEYDKHSQPDADEHSSSIEQFIINENLWPDKIKERIGVTESHHGFKYCPNTYNIWHTCSLYCVNKWGNVRQRPKEKYIRRYKRLLRKYPLPADWKDVYDYGCGSYYFYNVSTRKVSWLPPHHPNAHISSSAAILRKQLSNDGFNLNLKDCNSTHDNENEISIQTLSSYPSKKSKKRDLERTILRKQRL